MRGDTAELDEKGVPVSSVGNGWTYQEGSKSFIIEKEWCLTGFTGESSELSADIYTTVSKGAYVSGGTFRGRVYNSGTIIGGNVWLTHSVPEGSRIVQSAGKAKPGEVLTGKTK